MAHQVMREIEVFVVLVNGSFQCVHGEPDRAFEVRDNFNQQFSVGTRSGVAQVVRGVLNYTPSEVLHEND